MNKGRKDFLHSGIFDDNVHYLIHAQVQCVTTQEKGRINIDICHLVCYLLDGHS